MDSVGPLHLLQINLTREREGNILANKYYKFKERNEINFVP